MVQGLASELSDIGIASFSDQSISGLVIASGGVGVQHMAANSVSGGIIANASIPNAKLVANTLDASKMKVLGTGSPTGFGLSLQTGSSVTTAGSLADVAFGTPFGAAPFVMCTPHGTVDREITIVAGSLTTTGFTAISHGGASVEFGYMAVGSGNL